ncbi:MAG: hypothetical protein E3J25_01780 [Anaerolineales bacterium]|nr:MAG: hypothetical protein E3J25_01780 [Anaerolineales bacterium]
MPEILPDQVPSPRTPLVWDGTRYRAVRGHTDGTVQVRGEDQLFSFAGVVSRSRTDTISGVGGWVESAAPGAGVIWHITHIYTVDNTSPTTAHWYAMHHDAESLYFHPDVAARAASIPSDYKCDFSLGPDDRIRITFDGGLVGDTCVVRVFGHSMTLET